MADNINATIDDQTRTLNAGIGWQPGENIGTGAEVYAGTNLGTMQYRTLVATDATVAIVQNVDTIGFSAGSVQSVLDAHIADLANPHEVTSDQVANDSSNVTGVTVTDALDYLLSVDTATNGLLNTHTQNQSNPHFSTVANLADTTIATPANNHLLVYSTDRWVNEPLDSDQVVDGSTVGGANVEASLDLLDTTSTANKNDIATHRATVGDHTDVTLTTPAIDQSLVYDGASWVNYQLTSVQVVDSSTAGGANVEASLDNLKTIATTTTNDLATHRATVGDHTDVTMGAQSNGQMLISNGTVLGNTVTLGAANGVCPLGPDGKVPANHSPSGQQLRGGWDAATNTPNIGALGDLVDGDYWIVSEAGDTDLGNVTDPWNEGDWAMYAVGEPGSWLQIGIGNAVSSVFGRTGAVVALATAPYDYTSNIVGNDSTATGVTVTDALDYLLSVDTATNNSLNTHKQDQTNPHFCTVANLSDTTITTPSANDVLQYATSDWQNGPLSSSQILDNSTAGGANVEASLDLLQTATTDNATNKLDLSGGTMTGAIGLYQGTPEHAEALLFYDTTEHTLAYYNDAATMVVNVGQEVIARVRNASGGVLTDGDVVYLTGAIGNRPTVDKAIANTEATSKVFGICTAPISNNADGYVTCYGGVSGINTSGVSEGDLLYLSDTVAGTLTSIPPSPWAVKVGVTLTVATQGRIFVAPSRDSVVDSKLDQHIASVGGHTDVTITTPLADNVLVYSGSAWVNEPLDSDQVADASTVGGANVEASLDIVETTAQTNKTGLANHIASVGTHTDVSLTGPVADDLMIHNGAAWVNGRTGSTTVVNDSNVPGANVTAALDNHQATVADHTDVTVSTPEAGDLLVWNGTAWINATALEDTTGVVAAGSATPLSASVAYTEVVPLTPTTFRLANMTYAAGRLTIDYSGAPDLPTSDINGDLTVTMSILMPTANTTVEISFAIDGTPLVNADIVKAIVTNAGQQSAGTTSNVTLAIPTDDPVGTAYSVVYTATDDVTVQSMVLSYSGEPDVQVVAS